MGIGSSGWGGIESGALGLALSLTPISVAPRSFPVLNLRTLCCPPCVAGRLRARVRWPLPVGLQASDGLRDRDRGDGAPGGRVPAACGYYFETSPMPPE